MFVYILPLVAYFSGSLPFGWIIGKIHHINIRVHGSSATGGTQLLRSLKAVGLKGVEPELWFGISVVLDIIKALIPVTIALWIHDSLWYPILIGLVCSLGHTRSIWLFFDTDRRVKRQPWFSRLNGGKAVSTAFGSVVALTIPSEMVLGIPLLIGGVVFVLTYILSRKTMSMASLSGAGTAALLILGFVISGEISSWYLLLVLLAGFIFIMHKDNIVRIRRKAEHTATKTKRSQVRIT